LAAKTKKIDYWYFMMKEIKSKKVILKIIKKLNGGFYDSDQKISKKCEFLKIKWIWPYLY
jgi:hypothetical protein